MSGRLAQRIAVVTGSSSGIGRAIALTFHRQGAAVLCSDVTEASLNKESNETDISTHNLIAREGGKALFVKADVSDSSDVQSLVRKAAEAFGRIDIMVNNAGIGIEAKYPRRIYEFDDETWDKTMAINGKGVYLGCKHATAQMLTQNPLQDGTRGRIINLASILGLQGVPFNTSYVASKHAVMGITKVAAWDCAEHGILVNAICPGYVDTAMPSPFLKDAQKLEKVRSQQPYKGLGKPTDIANAALFLASDECSWVTGIGLPVDGGYSST